MRRVILGAVTVAVAALAAIGIIGRRRWAMRDEALPLEPAPPLGAAGAIGEEPAPDARPAPTTPSVDAETGFAAAPVARARRRKAAGNGPVGPPAPTTKAKPRARPRRASRAVPPSSEDDAAPS